MDFHRRAFWHHSEADESHCDCKTASPGVLPGRDVLMAKWPLDRYAYRACGRTSSEAIGSRLGWYLTGSAKWTTGY
jgi:hypothetical protein